MPDQTPNQRLDDLDATVQRLRSRITRLVTQAARSNARHVKADRRATKFERDLEQLVREVEDLQSRMQLVGNNPGQQLQSCFDSAISDLESRFGNLDSSLTAYKAEMDQVIAGLQEADRKNAADIDRLRNHPNAAVDITKVKVKNEVTEAGVDVRVENRWLYGLAGAVVSMILFWVIGFNGLPKTSPLHTTLGVVLFGIIGFGAGMALGQRITARLRLKFGSKLDFSSAKYDWHDDIDANDSDDHEPGTGNPPTSPQSGGQDHDHDNDATEQLPAQPVRRLPIRSRHKDRVRSSH